MSEEIAEPPAITIYTSNWEPIIDNNHIWLTSDPVPLEDDVFYGADTGDWDSKYFCSKKTWNNYKMGLHKHKISNDLSRDFGLIYKTLTMDYYEPL